MFSITPSTFERRRQLEVIQDQLFIMRAKRDQLEVETRALAATDYTLDRYYEYKNMLALRKVMAFDISRVAKAFEEKKELLEASIKMDDEKCLKEERKREREEAKPKGLVKKLSAFFHIK